MATRISQLPALPKIRITDPVLSPYITALSSLISTWRGEGDPRNKVVTFGDLVDSGSGFSIRSGARAATLDYASDEVVMDLTPPGAVTNFTTSSGLTSVFLS